MTKTENQKYNLEKGWPALLKDLNIPGTEVLRQARLPLDLLLRKIPSVTADEYFRFWEGLTYVTGNIPAFSLRLVQNISSTTMDPTIIAFLSCDNLNQALRRTAHYKQVTAPVRLEITQENDQTALSFAGLDQNTLPPAFVAFELTFWVQLARIATREQICPIKVESKIEIPEQAEYESFLCKDITRGEINRVVFAASDAAKPFLTANHAMWSILESAFEKRMETLTKESSFRERVRACLLEMLPSGHNSMNFVALKLAISARTLQRRLMEEGTSFREVLDELREELARHYLSSTEYSNSEISFLLGYEEPNSFFRAFRTWTGQTPEIIRANLN